MVANPLSLLLESLHRRFASLSDGEVATYIPELGRADPALFGIALATADGHLYAVGDARVPFTIQSVSKPFVYGLGLDDHGQQYVLGKVGVEPSGEAFNAISLEPITGRPRNPMINAGAIAAASLVTGSDSAHRWERVLKMLSGYAGRTLDLDEPVFRSELESGHRNRAIGHLLRNADIFDEDVDDVCGRYFRQCAVSVTCEDLALMAATLANGGLNPRTGERAIQPENVERVLSIMSTCGMYDATGSWVYRVGMPAKSGVGGGILAVLPGQFGIGVFSPALDPAGNSVRGVAVCEALSRDFGLHVLRPPVSPSSAVRGAFRLADVPSKRRRTPAEALRLDALARDIIVVQLQGPLVFSTAEASIRRTLDLSASGGMVVFDVKRTTAIDPAVCRLFGVLAREIAASGGGIAFAPLPPGDERAELIAEAAGANAEAAIRFFPALDAALEWCEDRALGREGIVPDIQREMDLGEHPLLASLNPAQLAALGDIAARQVFGRGERIIARDGPPGSLYLLCAGLVDVSVTAPGGIPHRLASQAPGTSFGELALLDEGARSADVDAATPVVCYVISVSELLSVEMRAPGLRLQIIASLARDLSDCLRRANREIEALAM